MSTQDLPTSQLPDVVTIEITRHEAQFLRTRCIQALSVIESNLRGVLPKDYRGPRHQTLLDDARAIRAMIKKLDVTPHKTKDTE